MKKRKSKKSKMVIQAVKAARSKSREDEIAAYGKLLNHHKVTASKKVYNRKRNKADQHDDLPYSFPEQLNE